MDDNIELLNMIVTTAQMGHNTLLQLEETTENEAFKTSLRIQLKAYNIILNEAKVHLEQFGSEMPKQNELARMGTYVSIKMKTMMDKSTRQIADMLLQGSNMGIIEMIKAVKDFPSADGGVKALAEKLISMQQRNVEELKAFL